MYLSFILKKKICFAKVNFFRGLFLHILYPKIFTKISFVDSFIIKEIAKDKPYIVLNKEELELELTSVIKGIDKIDLM